MSDIIGVIGATTCEVVVVFHSIVFLLGLLGYKCTKDFLDKQVLLQKNINEIGLRKEVTNK